jgi:hypothetical protein
VLAKEGDPSSRLKVGLKAEQYHCLMNVVWTSARKATHVWVARALQQCLGD